MDREFIPAWGTSHNNFEMGPFHNGPTRRFKQQKILMKVTFVAPNGALRQPLLCNKQRESQKSMPELH